MLYSIRTYLICLTSTIDSALSPPQFAHSTFLVLPTLLSPSLPSSPSTVEESRFWMALCKARGRVGDTSQHANNLINSLKKLVLLSNLLDQIPSWTFGAIVFMCSVCNMYTFPVLLWLFPTNTQEQVLDLSGFFFYQSSYRTTSRFKKNPLRREEEGGSGSSFELS